MRETEDGAKENAGTEVEKRERERSQKEVVAKSGWCLHFQQILDASADKRLG